MNCIVVIEIHQISHSCMDYLSMGKRPQNIYQFQLMLKQNENSRSFNGDPPHLTLNHGFPVIRLSRPKKVA